MDVSVLLPAGNIDVCRDQRPHGNPSDDAVVEVATHECDVRDSETLRITRVVYQSRFRGGHPRHALELERIVVGFYARGEWVDFEEIEPGNRGSTRGS